MEINTKNYLSRLGIDSDNVRQTLNNISDNEIDEAYINKLVEIYTRLKMQDEGIEKSQLGSKEAENIEDKIKEELYFYIKSLTMKAKVVVLENKIGEMGRNDYDKANNEIILGMHKMAYEALSTEDRRKKYEKTLIKQKQFNEELYELMEKNGGNTSQPIEIKKIMKGSVANRVRKIDLDVPEYNVEYKDEDINLCNLLSIGFNNGQFEDNVKKYIMFVRDNQSNITTGYEFYGNVKIARNVR